MLMTDMRPLMTVNQVCEYLGVSRNTLYRMIGRGELTAYRVGQRHRFRPEEVEVYSVRHPARAPICPDCGRERCRIKHNPDDWVVEMHELINEDEPC